MIIEESNIPAFSTIFPNIGIIEVKGLPIKDSEGKEYLAMVMPMPISQVAPVAPMEPAQESLPLGPVDGQG